jgi:hypothetical protein
MASGFDGSLSHDCAAEFEVCTLETDVLTISKFNVIWAAQAWFEGVC